MPTARPATKDARTPLGTILISSRMEIGSGRVTWGARVVAASVIGTSATETRTEATTRSSNPFGSANAVRNWPMPSPPIETIM